METFLAGGGAIILGVLLRFWLAHDARAFERRQAIRRGEIVEAGPVRPWGVGLVGPAPAGSLTRIDWALALGSLIVMIMIVVMGTMKVATG